MICEKCFKEYEQKFIGKFTDGGAETVEVSKIPIGSLLLTNYKPYFRLYFKAHKPLKKGGVKEIKFEQMFRAEFCANCGEKQSKDTA
jgi:hypothetical protein